MDIWHDRAQVVDGKLTMWMRTMQKAEEAGNDVNRRRKTKLEEVGLSGTCRSWKMKK